MAKGEVVSAGPARGYSWPPFEKGNIAALKHGAYSPAVIEPRAAELVEQMRPHCLWWTAADEPSVHAWARAEAAIERVSLWLAEHGGEMDAEGEVRSAANLLVKLESKAESLRARLGLDPASRAKLGRDTAAGQFDFARFAAEQARLMAEEEG